MPRTSFSPAHAAQVGRAVRTARQDVGMSQTALANRLDVSPAYINKLEAGRSNTTVGALARIAAALGADLEVQLTPRRRRKLSGAEQLVSAGSRV
jgi:transcriptional regulator with XRE-family HTH domain